MSEDVTLLTGATSGVGGAAAPQLAEAGGTVLVTGRNRRAGEAVADEIGTAHPDAESRFLRVDFADFDAIRGLARTVRRDYDRLDALVNKAGTASDERAVVDGVERTFAVNHLAPFLLTACLAPRLSENAPGRVVTTSSEVHRRGDCSDLDAVIAGADYDALDAYADSKLANVAFTWELAARLADDGVSAAAFQPGGGSRRQGCFVTPRCRPGCSSPWPDSRRASRLSARSRPRRPRARTSPTWSRTMTSNPAPPVYVDRRTVTAPAAGATDEPLRSRLWTRSAELVGVSAEVPAVDPLD